MENGLPFSLVITTADNYVKLADVANDFLKKAQASGQFFFSSLDLKFDTVTMKWKFDREKMGTYGVTMQQVSGTLGAYLSGAIITRVDIDSRAYPIVSQAVRQDRLNPQDLVNYYVTTASGGVRAVKFVCFFRIINGTGGVTSYEPVKFRNDFRCGIQLNR
ncbi:acriflavine resistance protein [Actinobacillus pleuropneumoniae]|nr:acriflavine resistance protein [Actinobacillus pleuropneumoniae]